MTSQMLLVAGAALTALPALAHEGHGSFGSHWHATDVLGFVAAAAAVAVVIWLSKK